MRKKTADVYVSDITEKEFEALSRVLGESRLKGAHLEIGTSAAGTLVRLMHLYEKPRPKFVVIDPMTHFPDQRSVIRENLKRHDISESEIDFREQTSWDAIPSALAKQEVFSFIFVDGNHGSKHVMQDFAWTRMLKVGGVVALHDCRPKFPGVAWAIRRFLRQYKSYRLIDQTESLVVIKKTAPSSVEEVSGFDVWLAAAVRTPLRFLRSFSKRVKKQPAFTPIAR